MRLLNNQWVKCQFFKVKPIKGDGKMKVVHQNLLLPLFSNPSDHTNKLDTESVVDQTVNMHGVICSRCSYQSCAEHSACSKA